MSCIVCGAGTAEAASNAETTMTQLVQEYTIRAQVRALCKKTGIKIDRTEHVANSLGHLAAVVDKLNSLDHPLKVQLQSHFALHGVCDLKHPAKGAFLNGHTANSNRALQGQWWYPLTPLLCSGCAWSVVGSIDAITQHDPKFCYQPFLSVILDQTDQCDSTEHTANSLGT